MVLFSALVFPQVLVLIAIAYATVKKASRHGSDEDNCAEDVENQLGKEAKAEINQTPRQGYNGVHEPDLSPATTARGVHEPDEDDTVTHGNLELQPDLSAATTVRGVREPDEDDRVTHGNLELLHCSSRAEKSCGRKDELHMVSQYHDDTGNNTLDRILRQPDLSAATTGRGAHEPAEDGRVPQRNSELDGHRESREEERPRETEAEESREEERHREMKSASKFFYFSTGISVAGIISIFSGYLGDQTGHAHTIPLKICTFFMLATFVSGASILIGCNLCSHIHIIFFRFVKYTTLAFLTLSMCSVSFLFLKMFSILAFVPTLFIVLISFILA